MIIQTRIDNGLSIKTRTYRDVIRGVNLSEWITGFYAQRTYCKWGEMIQLKGDKRIPLARFGTMPVRSPQVPIIEVPSLYIGHAASVTDVDDGAFGDEDYQCPEFSYFRIVWEEIS